MVRAEDTAGNSLLPLGDSRCRCFVNMWQRRIELRASITESRLDSPTGSPFFSIRFLARCGTFPMNSAPDAPRPWEAIPKWPRRAITCWLVFHLIAIVSAPASVAPASELSRSIWGICRPYLQALYLNHGYHFFAPDPGESTLLTFQVERADGSVVQDTIPRPEIWPRLMYHRHFMLTESLAFVASVSEAAEQAARPPEPPSGASGDPTTLEVSPPEVAIAPDAVGGRPAGEVAAEPPPVRGLLRDWYHSYARCILEQYDGERVRLTRVVHYLPEIQWMQESIARGEPLTLSERESFEEFPIGTFTREDGPLEGSEPREQQDFTDRPVPDMALTPAITGDRP